MHLEQYQKQRAGLWHCTVVSSSDEALKYFDDAVSSRFDYNPTEMRDLDAEKGSEGIGWVLSTEVRYFRIAGILEMNQTAAIERIAARFGLTDSRPLSVPYLLYVRWSVELVLTCPANCVAEYYGS